MMLTSPSSSLMTRNPLLLTHRAALTILTACVNRAEMLRTPVNIVVASRHGEIMASLAMDEAYFLSTETARNKALTAASHKCDTRDIPVAIANALALASEGKITNMAGGLPIWIRGECVGGVGIGGASDEDDIIIARAGIQSIGASDKKEVSSKPQETMNW
jgi:glc operon protein GlcG